MNIVFNNRKGWLDGEKSNKIWIEEGEKIERIREGTWIEEKELKRGY